MASHTRLIKRQGLNSDEISAIRQLATICNQHEGLDLKLNFDLLQTRPQDQINDFLYYEDNQLIGFLALFSFNSHEGEVSGMVHPAYRRRGIFSELLAAVEQEAHHRSLPSLLLIVEQASPSGQAFAHHLPITYDHSEHKMVLEEPRLPAIADERLIFRPARADDTATLAHITAQAFNIPEQEIDWYNQNTLARSDRRFYVGELDGVVIGKIDVSVNELRALIFGFGVLASHRGRGYGRQVLARTIQEIIALGQRTIWLEVETKNNNALSLYQSCGFQQTSSYDYDRLAVT